MGRKRDGKDENGESEDMRTTCTQIKASMVEYKCTVALAFVCV